MDFKNLLRSICFAQRATALPTRPDSELTSFGNIFEEGEPIMLDACVYIDQFHDKMPADIVARIATQSIYYLSLVLSELSFLFGCFDQTDPNTKGNLNTIKHLLSSFPDERVFIPLAQTMMRGAILAGSMARILHYIDAQHRKGLIDAMIATHAIERNLFLVTRNVADFDRFSQLNSKLKVAFYRI